MQIINLTPHTINFLDGDNNPVLTVDPSGVIARAKQIRTLCGTVAGIPVNQCAYGTAQGLARTCKGNDLCRFFHHRTGLPGKGRRLYCRRFCA